MKTTAIYPGTFDPITNGHLDLIKRALRTFDEVIVAVAPSFKKQPLFTTKERLHLIRVAVKGLRRVKIDSFSGLLVDYVREKKGNTILRGLRAMSDFEFEIQMVYINRKLNRNIETVFMMPSEEYSYLTSSIVKEVASFRGCIKGLVPEEVEKALKAKFKTVKYFIG
jgi:pantetheine-phosphate adenylyltransferase